MKAPKPLGSYMVLSLDVSLAVVTGLGVAYLAQHHPRLLERGEGILLIEAGLGVALLAVVLTALSIFVAFLGSAYIHFLREAIGMRAAFRPYKVVAAVSGIASVAALGGAFWWPEASENVRIGLIAACSGLVVWAVVGTVQLVTITAKHGMWRWRLTEIPAAAHEAFERRSRVASE